MAVSRSEPFIDVLDELIHADERLESGFVIERFLGLVDVSEAIAQVDESAA